MVHGINDSTAKAVRFLAVDGKLESLSPIDMAVLAELYKRDDWTRVAVLQKALGITRASLDKSINMLSSKISMLGLDFTFSFIEWTKLTGGENERVTPNGIKENYVIGVEKQVKLTFIGKIYTKKFVPLAENIKEFEREIKKQSKNEAVETEEKKKLAKIIKKIVK